MSIVYCKISYLTDSISVSVRVQKEDVFTPDLKCFERSSSFGYHTENCGRFEGFYGRKNGHLGVNGNTGQYTTKHILDIFLFVVAQTENLLVFDCLTNVVGGSCEYINSQIFAKCCYLITVINRIVKLLWIFLLIC